MVVAIIDNARGLFRVGPRVVDPPELEVMPGGNLDGTVGPTVEPASPAEESSDDVPGLADLEAAAWLVSAGLATRVVLTGFPSWPGLLWHAYRLAESADVLILPTVVRPGGRVDIVITRDASANG